MGNKAFLLGVNTDRLKYAENDVLLMLECLEQYNYNVTIAEEPFTRWNVDRKFYTWLYEDVDSTDTIIFYYSGHGYAPKGNLNLLLNNQNIKDPKNNFPIINVTNAFNECEVKEKIIILDCCRALEASRDWSPEQSNYYLILTASGNLPSQNSKEFDQLEAGFLTYYFHQGLTNFYDQIVNNKGEILIDSLYTWLRKKAIQHNASTNYTKVQEPYLLGNAGANIIIGKLTKGEFKEINNTINNLNQENLKTINKKLKETLNLYLNQCFRDDRAAKLEQAGEKNIEHKKNLVDLFIDLKFKQNSTLKPEDLKLQESLDESEKINFLSGKNLSVIKLLLQEYYPRIVIIGIAGQGKSTLSQQLAQIHRAKILNIDYDENLVPKIPRIPFKVILKDFAQWLTDKPEIPALEVYLAEEINKLAKRPGEVTSADIQEIFRCQKCLLILDGLDEVSVSKVKLEMLSRIQDFLEDRQTLNADVMVVATSRPNDYDNEFDPKQFWHLELALLTKEQVREYAQKWIKVQQLSYNQACKIIPTIEECQEDTNCKGLLTTPLQITIILIIIKGGQKPPSQRENLFNEYWLTIYRREEGKNIFQNSESELLNLHAYIGYILHRRAADKNIKSLLSTSEFIDEVSNFLRKQKGDKYSETNIKSKAEELVKQVGDRLVLIFQKETNFYGFDLRSFQEFFAAVHLTQQAANTEQRFKRFEAIASYAHWRNVALFSAGRISRNFNGEISNLVLLWQQMDRSKVNKHLKPGSWLALEIAADSSLTNNYSIQYSAIENGLEVLNTSLDKREENHLKSLLERLSNEEKENILCPILKDKIRNLPDSYLLRALSIYTYFFGVEKIILTKIDLLIQSNREFLINAALDFALVNEVEAKWIANRLTNYWDYAFEKILDLFVINFNYFKSILNTRVFSEKKLRQLISFILTQKDIIWRDPGYYSGFVNKNIAYLLQYENAPILIVEPNNLIEQIPLILQYFQKTIANTLRSLDFLPYALELEEKSTNEITIKIGNNNFRTSSNKGIINRYRIANYLLNEENINTLNNILERKDIIIELKILLIEIYLNSEDTKQEKILESTINIIGQNPEITDGFSSFYSIDKLFLPMISLINNRLNQINLDKNSLKEQLKNSQKIAQEIMNSIKTSILKLDDDNNKIDLIHRIQIGYNLDKYLSDLIPLSNKYQMSLEDLVDYYTFNNYKLSSINQNNHPLKINDMIFLDSLKDNDKLIKDANFLKKTLIYLINNSKWMLNSEGYEKGKEFLNLIIINWNLITENKIESRIETELIELIVTFFLKLISQNKNQTISKVNQNKKELELALAIFKNLSITQLISTQGKFVKNIVEELSESTLEILKNLLDETNEILFINSAIIWKFIIEYQTTKEKEIKQKYKINIKPKTIKKLIDKENKEITIVGIFLLAFTEYPIDKPEQKDQLLNNLKKALTQKEEEAWSKMLIKINISEEKKKLWSDFLEDILNNPRDYGTLILDAAIKRYENLNRIGDETITEQDEKKLGLP